MALGEGCAFYRVELRGALFREVPSNWSELLTLLVSMHMRIDLPTVTV